jgi:hypothetical protein
MAHELHRSAEGIPDSAAQKTTSTAACKRRKFVLHKSSDMRAAGVTSPVDRIHDKLAQGRAKALLAEAEQLHAKIGLAECRTRLKLS